MGMTIQVGDRVVMTGDSPWRGYSGVVVGYEDTPFGSRPLIVLDNGMRTLAMRDEHVQLAAVRSEAQGEEEALAALVVRIWTRCKNEGPHYRETDEFWADFERAYQLAALRSEAQGEERASKYGALLAFADAISDAVWGGERAWEQRSEERR